MGAPVVVESVVVVAVAVVVVLEVVVVVVVVVVVIVVVVVVLVVVGVVVAVVGGSEKGTCNSHQGYLVPSFIPLSTINGEADAHVAAMQMAKRA